MGADPVPGWWGWEGGTQSWKLLPGQPLTFSSTSPASWDGCLKKINCPPWFEQNRSEFSLKCGNFLQPGTAAVMSGYWGAVSAGVFHTWQMPCAMGREFAAGTWPAFSLCRHRNSFPSHPLAFTSTFALWLGAGTGCFGKKEMSGTCQFGLLGTPSSFIIVNEAALNPDARGFVSLLKLRAKYALNMCTSFY